jgi:hypothetical protein
VDGGFSETTLDRMSAAEVVQGLPVREFRWYKGRLRIIGSGIGWRPSAA